MNAIDLLALAIVVLVPFNAGVTVFLARLSRAHPELVTLRSRAYTQFVLLLCSAIGGYFALGRLVGLHFEPVIVTVLLSALILLPSVPGIYWTWLYRRDFR